MSSTYSNTAKYAIVVKTQKIRPTEGRFLLRFPFALRSGYSLLTAEDLISSLAMFFYIYFTKVVAYTFPLLTRLFSYIKGGGKLGKDFIVVLYINAQKSP